MGWLLPSCIVTPDFEDKFEDEFEGDFKVLGKLTGYAH